MEGSLAKKRRTVKLLRDIFRMIDRNQTGTVSRLDFMNKLSTLKVTLGNDELEGLLNRHQLKGEVDYTKALEEIQIKQVGEVEAWYIGPALEEELPRPGRQSRNLNISPGNALAIATMHRTAPFSQPSMPLEATAKAKELAKVMLAEGAALTQMQLFQRQLLKADSAWSGFLPKLAFTKAMTRLPVSDEAKQMLAEYACVR